MLAENRNPNSNNWVPTAFKEKVLEYVDWEGMDGNKYYPKWVTDFVDYDLINKPLNITGDVLKIEDVLVQHLDGSVTHYSWDIFQRMFQVIVMQKHINLAAFKEDVLWYMMAHDDVPQEDGSTKRETYVTLKNKRGEFKDIPLIDFVDMFASFGNNIPTIRKIKERH